MSELINRLDAIKRRVAKIPYKRLTYMLGRADPARIDIVAKDDPNHRACHMHHIAPSNEVTPEKWWPAWADFFSNAPEDIAYLLSLLEREIIKEAAKEIAPPTLPKSVLNKSPEYLEHVDKMRKLVSDYELLEKCQNTNEVKNEQPIS